MKNEKLLWHRKEALCAHMVHAYSQRLAPTMFYIRLVTLHVFCVSMNLVRLVQGHTNQQLVTFVLYIFQLFVYLEKGQSEH